MRQKGLAPIVILVLIALFGAGAYFLGTKNILKLPISLSLPNLFPSLTPTPSPTANWKTYTSSEFGFTFKYPQDWEVKKETPENVKYKEFGSPDFELGKMFGECDLFIQNMNSPSTVMAFDVIEKGSDGGFCWSAGYFYDYSKRTITILGKPMDIEVSKWKIADRYAKSPGEEPISPEWKGDVFQVFSGFFNDKYIFPVALLYNSKEAGQSEEIFDQILTTFKFQEGEVVIPTPPAGWTPHKFSQVSITLYTPTDWQSSLQYYPDTNSNLIRFWKKQSPSIIPIQLDIKPDWSNTGDTQYYAKNYKVAGTIDAIRIDPPKKEERAMERYQSNVFFEKSGKVFVFQCVHNWVQDYLETCNLMLETMKFE